MTTGKNTSILGTLLYHSITFYYKTPYPRLRPWVGIRSQKIGHTLKFSIKFFNIYTSATTGKNPSILGTQSYHSVTFHYKTWPDIPQGKALGWALGVRNQATLTLSFMAEIFFKTEQSLARTPPYLEHNHIIT